MNKVKKNILIRFNKNILIRLLYYLNEKRRKQLFGLTVLVIMNGFFEAFSIISLLPFLSVLADPDSFYAKEIVTNISGYFGIYSSNEILLPITLLFSSSVLLSTSLRLFNIWFLQRYVAYVDIELSSLLLKKNLYQTYSHYLGQNSGEIIGLILNQSALASSAITNLLNVFVAFTLSISIVFSLFLINKKIVLFSIILFALYYLLITKKVTSKLQNSSSVVASLENERIKIIQQAFGGFRDIIINATQKTYLNIFSSYQKRVRIQYANSDWLITFPKYFIESFIVIIGAWIGFSFALRGNTAVEFIPLLGTYTFAVLRLLPNIQQIYAGWARYRFKYSGLKKFLNGLDKIKMEIIPKSDNLKQLVFKESINFQNVFFSYINNHKSKLILENINLSIKKGEHLGIVGSTGSGKSTLLDLIMGLIDPSSGDILVDSTNLHENKINLLKWRKSIAHVPQNIYLAEGSIAENIAFGKSLDTINMEDIEEAAEKANILDFIKNTKDGFKTHIGERGINLSGGQRQRIAIARALFRKKKVLILDEATSALDLETEKSIVKNLKDLSKDLTIITVTHRIQSLAYCNRIIRIAKRKIEEVNDFKINK